jgi:ATP-binding cassette, subfamily B, bacterial CvaB/MchF/RaxB
LLLAFIAYKDQFLRRSSELVNKAVDLTMLRLHAERLADIALTAPEQRGVPSICAEVDVLPASIELRNLDEPTSMSSASGRSTRRCAQRT